METSTKMTTLPYGEVNMTAGGSNCPVCGQSAVVTTNAPLTVEFRDSSYAVTGFTYDVCTECSEEFFVPGQVDAIQSAAVAMAREAQGLLTPEQIRQLRTDLSLRQNDLEDILGVGPKSVTRWEKGTVFQSAVADRFMRKLWQHPEILVGDSVNVVLSPCAGRNFATECFAPATYEPATSGVVKNDLAFAA